VLTAFSSVQNWIILIAYWAKAATLGIRFIRSKINIRYLAPFYILLNFTDLPFIVLVKASKGCADTRHGREVPQWDFT